MSGRPTVITQKVVSLLVASFHSGLTVREACWQSGISHEAYYNRLRSDEQFADTIAKAQSEITVTAKKLIAKEIRDGNVSAAKWWLERKARDEFGKPIELVEITNQEPEMLYSEIEIQEGMERLKRHWIQEYEDQKRGYTA